MAALTTSTYAQTSTKSTAVVMSLADATLSDYNNDVGEPKLSEDCQVQVRTPNSISLIKLTPSNAALPTTESTTKNTTAQSEKSIRSPAKVMSMTDTSSWQAASLIPANQDLQTDAVCVPQVLRTAELQDSQSTSSIKVDFTAFEPYANQQPHVTQPDVTQPDVVAIEPKAAFEFPARTNKLETRAPKPVKFQFETPKVGGASTDKQELEKTEPAPTKSESSSDNRFSNLQVLSNLKELIPAEPVTSAVQIPFKPAVITPPSETSMPLATPFK